jgi:zinc D-Ala-D-Ala carboxypeptidase
MGDLSDHFSRTEFRCKGAGQPGHQPHSTTVDPHLVQHLEKLRALAGGRPLRIVSGHRCRWWNLQVKGASESRHVVGDAADIPAGYATTTEAEAAGFSGIGSQGPWALHVDVRPGRARWTY